MFHKLKMLKTCFVLQLLVLSSQRLLSLVELPTLAVPGGGVTAGLTTAQSQVRLLLRDLSGKSCWDASILYCSPEDSSDSSLKCWAPSSGEELSFSLLIVLCNF